MSDEITAHGLGVRGTFKLEKEPEYKAKVNSDVLTKEVERGSWWWEPKTETLVPVEKRERVQVHAVVQDTIDPVESMATSEGKVFESRSAYDRHLAEHGYQRLSKKEQRQEWARAEAKSREQVEWSDRAHKEDWERAENDVRYGNVEIDEKERERCRQEERAYQAFKQRQRTTWVR